MLSFVSDFLNDADIWLRRNIKFYSNWRMEQIIASHYGKNLTKERLEEIKRQLTTNPNTRDHYYQG